MNNKPAYLALACPECEAPAGMRCLADDFAIACKKRIELVPSIREMDRIGAKIRPCLGRWPSQRCRHGQHGECRGWGKMKHQPPKPCSCQCHGKV